MMHLYTYKCIYNKTLIMVTYMTFWNFKDFNELKLKAGDYGCKAWLVYSHNLTRNPSPD